MERSNSHNADKSKEASSNDNWMVSNVANPFLNSLALEPLKVLEDTGNAISKQLTGKEWLPQVELQQTNKDVKPWSAEFFAQNIASGLAMVVPYGLAGRVTAGSLRLVGKANCLRSGAQALIKSQKAREIGARIIASNKTGQILGAGIYDFAKEPEKEAEAKGKAVPNGGEPAATTKERLATGGAGAASFAVYEAMNPLLHKTGVVGRFLEQSGIAKKLAVKTAGLFTIGATGSAVGSATRTGINEGRLIRPEEMQESALSGGAMNIILPTVQHGIGKAINHLNIKLRRGIPIQDYVKDNNIDLNSSPNLKKEINTNAFARVQPIEEAAHSVNVQSELIMLSKGATAKDFGHELAHLGQRTDKSRDQVFAGLRQRLQDLETETPTDKSKETRESATAKLESIKQDFIEQRIKDEVKARLTEQAIEHELSRDIYGGIAANQSKHLTGGAIFDNVSNDRRYQLLFEKQFEDFVESKGKTLPQHDYALSTTKDCSDNSNRSAASCSLERYLSEGRLQDAKEILDVRLLAPEDLKAEGIRSAAVDRLKRCLSDGYVYDAKEILDMGLLTAEDLKVEGIRSAAVDRLERYVSKRQWQAAKQIVDIGLLTAEDMKSEGIRDTAGRTLEAFFSHGRVEDAKQILDIGLLDAEGIRNAAVNALETRLSKGWIDSVKEISDMGLLDAERVRSTAVHALEACLSTNLHTGLLAEAKKILDMGLLTEEDVKAEGIRSAAGHIFENRLSEGRIQDAKKLMDMGLLDTVEIRIAAGRGLESCLSNGRIDGAKRLVDMGLLDTEGVRSAVRHSLEACLSNGRIQDAKTTLDMGLLTAKDENTEGIRSAASRSIEKCLSNARIQDAKTIFDMGLLTAEDVKAERIRSAAGRSLETCLSNVWVQDVQKIFDMGLLTAEDLKAKRVRSAAGRCIEKCLSYSMVHHAKEILDMGLITTEDVQTEEVCKSARHILAIRLSEGMIKETKQVLDLGLLTAEDLKAEEIRSAAGRGLEKRLSEGRVQDVKDILDMGLLDADEIRSAAGRSLETSLSSGTWRAAKEILDMGLLDADQISSAAGRSLETSLLKCYVFNAKKILGMGLLSEKDIKTDKMRSAAERTLEACLSEELSEDAKEILDMGLLDAEQIRSAAGRSLETSLRTSNIDNIEKIIELKLLDQSTVDNLLRQSAEAGHITNVVRTGFAIGKDFKSITKQYLGIPELTNENAEQLFERMRAHDPCWQNYVDAPSFEEGAAIFGPANMLRYVFKPKTEPHHALDGFHNVIRLFHSSKLDSKDFYNNILMQVNRDNAIDESGDSFARLKAIANDSYDDVDTVLQKAKDYPDIKTIQELTNKFPDKQSIFSSWPRLEQFSKLQYFINRIELLPKIQQLRANGQRKHAKWLEALTFHPDSKVGKTAIEDFLLKDPENFLDRNDSHSEELHQLLKPSNYIEVPHLDLTAHELRDALIEGTLDRLQVFTPMKVEYEIGGADLASEVRRALGSREKTQQGEAQNTGKLFHELNKLLKQNNLTVANLLNGSELLPELSAKIRDLLYNKEFGLAQQPSSLKLIAEIHKKSDPLAVVAGDDTASCMEFGSGKNNVYMFNPNDALFTVRLVRPDGTQRTIAQSVLTKDVDVKEHVPTIQSKLKDNQPLHAVLPEEGLRNDKTTIAADNIEVHPNYKSDTYQSALESTYRDFFARYVDLYGAKENLHGDKIVIGLGYTDALQSLPREQNTFIPKAPVAYSDKTHGQVLKLSLSAPQTTQLKANLPKQVVRSASSEPASGVISPLTFQDTLPVSYLESKIYQEVPSLHQGLYDLENTLIAKDINNAAKERPNLSFKYTDKDGNLRGYFLAYEGVADINGTEQPVVYIGDFASESYIKQDPQTDHSHVGGKLLLKFVKSYKQNYLDKGNLVPIYTNARSETSYALLMKHMQSLGRKFGYRFDIEEVETHQADSTTMHDIILVPHKID